MQFKKPPIFPDETQMHSKIDSAAEVSDIDFQNVERQFTRLLHLENLDQKILQNPALKEAFEDALGGALSDLMDGKEYEPRTLLFLQRILYRINRLKLFWYDDLKNYANENSPYLFGIQAQVESAWQVWESNQIDTKQINTVPAIKKTLRDKVAEDLNPKSSMEGLFFRNEMTKTGYRRLLSGCSSLGVQLCRGAAWARQTSSRVSR